MKPIEPGCLVMVVDATDASYIGITGTAVCVVGSATHAGTYWEVSSSDRFHNQRCLLRIDGSEPESVESEEDREVPA